MVKKVQKHKIIAKQIPFEEKKWSGSKEQCIRLRWYQSWAGTVWRRVSVQLWLVRFCGMKWVILTKILLHWWNGWLHRSPNCSISSALVYNLSLWTVLDDISRAVCGSIIDCTARRSYKAKYIGYISICWGQIEWILYDSLSNWPHSD